MAQRSVLNRTLQILFLDDNLNNTLPSFICDNFLDDLNKKWLRLTKIGSEGREAKSFSKVNHDLSNIIYKPSFLGVFLKVVRIY